MFNKKSLMRFSSVALIFGIFAGVFGSNTIISKAESMPTQTRLTVKATTDGDTPLANTEIFLDGTNVSHDVLKTTDNQGNVVFDNLPEGHYRIGTSDKLSDQYVTVDSFEFDVEGTQQINYNMYVPTKPQLPADKGAFVVVAEYTPFWTDSENRYYDEKIWEFTDNLNMYSYKDTFKIVKGESPDGEVVESTDGIVEPGRYTIVSSPLMHPKNSSRQYVTYTVQAGQVIGIDFRKSSLYRNVGFKLKTEDGSNLKSYDYTIKNKDANGEVLFSGKTLAGNPETAVSHEIVALNYFIEIPELGVAKLVDNPYADMAEIIVPKQEQPIEEKPVDEKPVTPLPRGIGEDVPQVDDITYLTGEGDVLVTVVDKNNNPVSDVEVVIKYGKDKTFTIITDDNGQVMFKGVPVGEHEVVVEKAVEGYVLTHGQNVSVKRWETVNLIYYLVNDPKVDESKDQGLVIPVGRYDGNDIKYANGKYYNARSKTFVGAIPHESYPLDFKLYSIDGENSTEIPATNVVNPGRYKITWPQYFDDDHNMDGSIEFTSFKGYALRQTVYQESAFGKINFTIRTEDGSALKAYKYTITAGSPDGELLFKDTVHAAFSGSRTVEHIMDNMDFYINIPELNYSKHINSIYEKIDDIIVKEDGTIKNPIDNPTDNPIENPVEPPVVTPEENPAVTPAETPVETPSTSETIVPLTNNQEVPHTADNTTKNTTDNNINAPKTSAMPRPYTNMTIGLIALAMVVGGFYFGVYRKLNREETTK